MGLSGAANSFALIKSIVGQVIVGVVADDNECIVLVTESGAGLCFGAPSQDRSSTRPTSPAYWRMDAKDLNSLIDNRCEALRIRNEEIARITDIKRYTEACENSKD